MLTAFSSYCALFFILKNFFGTEPRRARHIVSFSNAAFLSFMSIISASVFTVYGEHGPDYFLRKSEQVWLADYTIGYFAADMVLGHFYGGLNLLTGYIHHGAYMVLVFYLKTQNHSNLIYMCLPFEIPTMFLDLKRIMPASQQGVYNMLFGTTFVLFRIIGNVIVIEHALDISNVYAFIATLMLITHIGWFCEWLSKLAPAPQNQVLTSPPITGV
jgi:hypothetical protein